MTATHSCAAVATAVNTKSKESSSDGVKVFGVALLSLFAGFLITYFFLRRKIIPFQMSLPPNSDKELIV